MELAQDRLRRPLNEWLHDAYWVRHRTFDQIASELREVFGVSVRVRTLSDWFQRLGIPATRSPRPEARKAAAV